MKREILALLVAAAFILPVLPATLPGSAETSLQPVLQLQGIYSLVTPVLVNENGTIKTYVALAGRNRALIIDPVTGTAIAEKQLYRTAMLAHDGPSTVLYINYNGATPYHAISPPNWTFEPMGDGYAVGAVPLGNGAIIVVGSGTYIKFLHATADGTQPIASRYLGLPGWSPSSIPLLATTAENGRIYIAVNNPYTLDDADKRRLRIVEANTEGGTVNVTTITMPNATEAYYAPIQRLPPDTELGAILGGWFAGASPASQVLYVINLSTLTMTSASIRQMLGTELRDLHLYMLSTSEGPRIIVTGVDNSTFPGAPMVAIIDPAGPSLVQAARLEGYGTDGLAAELGSYLGNPALYLLVYRNLLVVDPLSLSLVDVAPVEIETPVAVGYGAYGGVAMLVVAGYNETGDPVSLVYSVGGLATPTLLTAEAPAEAYVGEPFRVNVSLSTVTGQPLAGATVVVEALVGAEWVEIAAATTGSDGKASISVVLGERGVYTLRARYPGGEGVSPSVTGAMTVRVLDRAVASVELVPGTTTEGVPVGAVVTLQRPDGAPLGGVMVVLEASEQGQDWAAVAAGMTGPDGRALLTVSLPAGEYVLRARAVDSLVETVETVTATLTVLPPGTPPPEGPYVAPVGRVLAFAPPMAEKGRPAAAVFAFYYGETPVEPEQISVAIAPQEQYTLEQVQPGVYRVVFTPSTTGVYTVVVTATWMGRSYVGAASFMVYNVSERVQAWDQLLAGLADRLLELNQTLTEYLESINESLARLNLTRIQALVESTSRNTSIILVRLQALNQSLDTGIAMVLANITSARAGLETLIIDNWHAIAALNTTVQGLASKLNTSISQVRVLVARNGELIAAVNTSIASLARALEEWNASIAGLITAETGRVMALINTSTGLILADLDALRGLLEEQGYTLSLVNETLVRVETRLDSINVSLQTALSELGLIKGSLESLQRTAQGIIAEIRLANGSIARILLDRLDPKIEQVAGTLALINTTMGLLVANTTTIAAGIAEINQGIAQALDRLGQIQERLEQAPTTEDVEQASKQATTARNIALAATGLGAAGLGAAALSLVRRP